MFYTVLYNPLSACGKGETNAKRLAEILKDSRLEFVDIRTITDYSEYFSDSSHGITVICGGDGTLNRFINMAKNAPIPEELYYFPSGCGNDFMRDAGGNTDEPINLKKYLSSLPRVTVNGNEYLFLNNVGFGIDGYCTAEGDRLRDENAENINYTSIAIKGLLGAFKPVDATVTVDGKTTEYRKVWLAPTMKGRYYGGGMMPTPDQDRFDEDKKVSLMVFYGKGKLATLAVFPSIFKGEHIRHKDMVKIEKGNVIKVKFNRPTPLQIDGETILDVTEYEVKTI